ncbi:unnamed protein product [Rotaria sordida]|uniref:Uncharacterized protein n=1 Tax=Rotaria sordida TaxID=392033 RepID=A0A813UF01_9BILA|nr:unnamed protein product [Rotaria sordida]CAF4084643.1 unnamed protein product [Rotaria sordida]
MLLSKRGNCDCATVGTVSYNYYTNGGYVRSYINAFYGTCLCPTNPSNPPAGSYGPGDSNDRVNGYSRVICVLVNGAGRCPCPGNVCGTGLCYITISPGNTGFNVGGTPC